MFSFWKLKRARAQEFEGFDEEFARQAEAAERNLTPDPYETVNLSAQALSEIRQIVREELEHGLGPRKKK